MDKRRSEGSQARSSQRETESETTGRSVGAGRDPEDRPDAPPPSEGGTPAELESRTRRAQAGHKSSDDIERDIARTRHQMDDTFGEIQRRLQPDRLREQAQDAVRDTFKRSAQSAGDRMFNTIRENPIPSFLSGVGLSWLLARAATGDSGGRRRRGRDYDDRYRGGGRGRRVRYYDGDYDRYEGDRYAPEGYHVDEYDDGYGDDPYYDDPYYHEESARSVAERERAELYDSDDSGEGRSAGEKASEKADQARRQARQTADKARRTAQQYGRRARRQAQRAESQLERWMEENPLAVGAATLAAGAFTGLMIPKTHREDELMGPARDRAMQQAKGYAQEAAERGQRVAQEAAQDAKETAQKEGEREKERAKSEHSSGDS